MEIVEKYIQGKYDNPKLCEDGICESENYIAVIDGVSSQSDFKYEGKKLGKIICDILLEAIPKMSVDLDCFQAIKFLNEYIIKFYKEHVIYDKICNDAADQPAASVIIYSKSKNQIWLIGDCTALCGEMIIKNNLAVDELYTNIRKMVIEYFLATGYSEKQLLENDIGYKFVQNLSKRQPYIRNKKFNSIYDYAVIDGFNMPDVSLVKCIDVPENIEELVFASDGYREPKKTLDESEKFIKHMRETDPLCYKEYLNFKSFTKGLVHYDDRAYIRFKIK